MLLDSSQLVADRDLNKVLSKLEQQIEQKQLTFVRREGLASQTPFKPEFISTEFLNELIQRPGDPLDVNEQSDLFHISTNIGPELFSALWKYFPDKNIKLSGHFLYPSKGGYMGWHTNAGAPGIRIYMVYVRETGKSFFRYKNPETGAIVDSYDFEGWNIRMFSIDPKRPFWHCVYADTERYSFGVNIMDPL